MLIEHFERLGPICPACRLEGRDVPLALRAGVAEEGVVEAGVLSCRSCGADYPIVDGVPILVPDVARFTQDNLFYLLARDDLPAAVADVIADAAGPGSAYDVVRQHLSSYVWDHWGDQDADEGSRTPHPGAIVRAVEAGLAQLDMTGLPEGPILDIGCGVGRSVVELTRRTGRRVLGIDLSVPLSRFGAKALRSRTVRYARRRIGLAYDPRRFRVGLPWPQADVDVWLCDVLALPFAAQRFAMVTGFNVLDCLVDPSAGVAAIAQVLADGGAAMLSTPFDWSGSVTPAGAWLGGRVRGEDAGAAEPALAALLSADPFGADPLQDIRTAEIDWHVRLHERAYVCYRAHIAIARRRAAMSLRPSFSPA